MGVITPTLGAYESGVATRYFVSPSGSDSVNNGKLSSAPFATIAHAISTIGSTHGCEIFLLPGTHPLPAGVTLPIGTTLRATYAFDKTTQPGAVVSVTDTVNPAFTVNSGCTIEGIEVWYPNQSCANGGSPTTYPSTFVSASGSQGAKFRRIIARNPWALFDFSGSGGHTRFEVREVIAYPLFVGVVTDYASDFDVFEDVYFNPAVLSNYLGTSIGASYLQYTYNNATAFHVQRCDFGMFSKCYAYGYAAGFKTDLSGDTTSVPDNIQVTDCAFDECSIAALLSYGRDITFKGCHFNSTKAAGITSGTPQQGVVGSNNLISFRLENCRILNCAREGVNTNGAQVAQIVGCRFYLWAVDGSGTYAAVNVIGNTTASTYSAVTISGCQFDAAMTGQTGNLVKGVTLDGTNTQHRVRVIGNGFRGIGNVGLQAFPGSDSYVVTGNIFEDCALDVAYQGTPTHTYTTGNITVTA